MENRAAGQIFVYTMIRLPAGFQVSFRMPSNTLCPHSTRTIDLIAAYRTVHSLSSHIKCSTAIVLHVYARSRRVRDTYKVTVHIVEKVDAVACIFS